MKYSIKKNKIVTTGAISESKTCNIDVNAKAFNVLSSGLYKNIIKAFIREYSTNAQDEHIEAGVTKPFDVHLPTEKEPYFYVRDYGRGLDQEEFQEVYFTYFRSTKEDSPELQGVLGLGSKVIMSEDIGGGTIESWKDGWHYIYSVYISDKGTPDYCLLSKTESNEDSGIKVKISVPGNQINEYISNAKEVYRCFKQRPNFVGEQLEYKTVYETGKLDYNLTNNHGCQAIMGNVAYPIEENFELSDYEAFIECNLDLFFEIGELQFTPSRETLKYTKKTVRSLKEKFEKVKKLIVDDSLQEVNDCLTEWEAIKKFRDIKENSLFMVQHALSDQFKYRGKELSIKDLDIFHTLFNLYRKAEHSSDKLPIYSKTLYVINDIKIGAISRCKELRDKTRKPVRLLSWDGYKKIPYTRNLSDFILASSLPKPESKARQSKVVGKISKLVSQSSYVMSCWKMVEEADVIDKIYVIRDRYRVIYKNIVTPPGEIKRYVDNLQLNKEVYGISKKDEQNFIKKGWVNLESLINKSLEKIEKELKKDIDFAIKYNTIEEMFYSKFYGFNIIGRNLNKIKDRNLIIKTDFKEILNEFDFLLNNKDKFQTFKNKLENFQKSGGILALNKNEKIYNDLKEKIQKYSLIESTDINKDVIIYYIMGVNYVNGDL